MDRRSLCELMLDGKGLIEWLRSEARAQRERARNWCLVLSVLAGGCAVVRLAQDRAQAAVPAFMLAALFLVVWIALLRRRTEEAARTLIFSLRHRPHVVRRISHVVYGRFPFRKHGVVIADDRGGYLSITTRHWDVVVDGLAPRCPNARVDLFGSPARRWAYGLATGKSDSAR